MASNTIRPAIRYKIHTTHITLHYKHLTRKASCRWQTRTMLAKRLHGLCKRSGVVSCMWRVSHVSHITDACMPTPPKPLTAAACGGVRPDWRENYRKNLPTLVWHVPLGWPLANSSTNHTLPETRIMGLWGYQTVYTSRSCFRSVRHNTGVWRTDRRTRCCH